jgi:hypothetical protein
MEIQAVVEKVILGLHGPFVVARSDRVAGSVTFSLDHPVWQEDDRPEVGMVVILSDIRQKTAGWRAMQARYLRPTDEISNQQAILERGASNEQAARHEERQAE